jgi:hypothetical protein
MQSEYIFYVSSWLSSDVEHGDGLKLPFFNLLIGKKFPWNDGHSFCLPNFGLCWLLIL